MLKRNSYKTFGPIVACLALYYVLSKDKDRRERYAALKLELENRRIEEEMKSKTLINMKSDWLNPYFMHILDCAIDNKIQ